MASPTYVLERDQRQAAEVCVAAGVALGWQAFYGTKMPMLEDDAISSLQMRELFGFGSAEQLARFFFHSTYFKSTTGERLEQLKQLTKLLQPYKYLLAEVRKEHFSWASISIKTSFGGNRFRSATWDSELIEAAVVYQFLMLLHRWETSEIAGDLNQHSWDGLRDLITFEPIMKNHVLVKELFATLGEATLER